MRLFNRWVLSIVMLGLVVINQSIAQIDDIVRLDLFTSAGCTECEQVKADVLPELELEFEGFYELVEHNLGESSTVPLLIAYQERCNNHDNGRVSIVVDHTWFLSGYHTIATGLLHQVNAALVGRQSPGWSVPQPPELDSDAASEIVERRASKLTLPVVALGGLLDGFNPCAISTLVFFMGVLVVTKATRRTRWLVGISFITASFLVYMGLGFGFLYLFRQNPGFMQFKRVIEVVLGLCMIPLAVLSFRDAFRFKRSQKPADVTLQIPDKIKGYIHGFMRSRLGTGGPIVGGFITGAVVTLLESVCTGQSYVPVLSYMLKEDQSNLTLWGLLVVYNLLFVLPLTVVFICFHRGVQLIEVINWSKRNLVLVKVLLGIFFSAMAILLLVV